MNKKKSPQQQDQDQLEESPKFLDLESRVFSVINGKMYIGREEIPPTLRSLLRDEAVNIQATRLWEIMNASVINEAYNHALLSSTDFNQVQFAKALKHWSHFMINVMHLLSKK